MKMRKRVLMAVALLAACNKQGAPTEDISQHMALKAHEVLVFVMAAPLHLAPTDAIRVPRPYDATQTVENVIGTVSKGKLATLRNARPGWSEVVLDDDAEGWVHTDSLVPARSVTEATVEWDAALRQAPNDEALALGIIKRGELIFVRNRGPQFAEVVAEPFGMGWVDNRILAEADEDVAVSHLLVHQRLARRFNDLDEVSELFDEARVRYPKSKFLDLMSDEVDFLKMHETPLYEPHP